MVDYNLTYKSQMAFMGQDFEADKLEIFFI